MAKTRPATADPAALIDALIAENRPRFSSFYGVKLDGYITAEVTGTPGPSCLEDMNVLTALVPDTSVADSRLTDDYYRNVSLSPLSQTLSLNETLEERP